MSMVDTVGIDYLKGASGRGKGRGVKGKCHAYYACSYPSPLTPYGFGAAGAAPRPEGVAPRPAGAAGAGVGAGGFGVATPGGEAGFGAAPAAGPPLAAAAAANRLMTSGVMSSDGSTKIAPASPLLES